MSEGDYATHLPAPPPSAALLEAVARATPVRTRRPVRAFALVAAASTVYAALWLLLSTRRADLSFLPRLTWIMLGITWLAAFLTLLGAALLPRRGAVLPDGWRASRLTVAVALGVVLLGLALTPVAPGHTVILMGARAQVARGLHCLTFALWVAVVPMVLGVVALRQVLFVGRARLTAAVGAAGGALGGLTLHVLCPVGGALHVGLGHGGAVALAALGGAALGALLDRRA